MSIQTKNEYLITFQNSTGKVHLAEDTKIVAAALENTDNPIVQITRQRTGVTVSVPDVARLVKFKIQVTPQGAINAGCVATPTEYRVLEGTPVIFQALAAAGFNFVEWLRDGETVSTDNPAEIAISAPAETENEAVYEAKFAPDA